MKDIINYAKTAKEAYINYISTNTYDINLCKEISEYINNIDSLTKKHSDKLTEFINANTTQTKDLADLYVPDNYPLRDKFKRIIPMKLSKPISRIYKAKGNFNSLIATKGKIKIRKKIQYKPKPVQ